MCDNRHPRVFHVEPVRDLSVGDDVDVADPRRKLLYGAQRVAQLLVTSKHGLVILNMWAESDHFICSNQPVKEGRKEMFYLTTH